MSGTARLAKASAPRARTPGRESDERVLHVVAGCVDEHMFDRSSHGWKTHRTLPQGDLDDFADSRSLNTYADAQVHDARASPLGTGRSTRLEAQSMPADPVRWTPVDCGPTDGSRAACGAAGSGDPSASWRGRPVCCAESVTSATMPATPSRRMRPGRSLGTPCRSGRVVQPGVAQRRVRRVAKSFSSTCAVRPFFVASPRPWRSSTGSNVADRDAADREADTVAAAPASVGVGGLAGRPLVDRRRARTRSAARSSSPISDRLCEQLRLRRSARRRRTDGPTASRRCLGRDGDALGDRSCRRTAAASVVDGNDRHRPVQSPLPNRRRHGHRPRSAVAVSGRRRHRTDRLRPARTATSPPPTGVDFSSGRYGASSRSATEHCQHPPAVMKPAATMRRRPHRTGAAAAGSRVCATAQLLCAYHNRTRPRWPPTSQFDGRRQSRWDASVPATTNTTSTYRATGTGTARRRPTPVALRPRPADQLALVGAAQRSDERTLARPRPTLLPR